MTPDDLVIGDVPDDWGDPVTISRTPGGMEIALTGATSAVIPRRALPGLVQLITEAAMPDPAPPAPAGDPSATPALGELIGEMKDGRGRDVQFAQAHGLVLIQVTPHSGHHGRIALGEEQLDEFARLYSAAQAAARRQKGKEPPYAD